MTDHDLKPFEDLKEILSNGGTQQKKLQMIGLSVAELGIKQIQFMKQYQVDKDTNDKQHCKFDDRINVNCNAIKDYDNILLEGKFIKKYSVAIVGGIIFCMQLLSFYFNYFKRE